jgi:secretory carrier-associated membrane protein
MYLRDQHAVMRRYGRLYRAMMSDGALSFAGFFFFFLIHTCFCIWSAVSPSFIRDGQDYAHAGWLPALELFKAEGGGSKFAAICYCVGVLLMPPVLLAQMQACL